jgi:hypothetical protein
LTLTDPQTWHEVYHGNKRLCFLQQISTSKRSHILLQRSTIQIIAQTRFVYWLQLNNSTAQTELMTRSQV